MLKIWLPCDVDSRNIGLSTITSSVNGPTLVSDGGLGKCYSFDGNDDYIALNGQPLYDTFKGGANPFSMTFFIKHSDASRAVIFGDYQLTGAINFNVELSTAHTVRLYWNGAPDYTVSSCNVGQNTWAHVAITYNGNQLKFFKNGALSSAYTITLSAKNKTTGNYYLGRDSRTGTTAMNGRLYDFRIYDNALLDDEVKEIYENTRNSLRIWLKAKKRFKNDGLNKIVEPVPRNVELGYDGFGFNGSNSYLSFASGVSQNTKAFSYATWVRFNNISATQCLYSQRTGVGVGLAIFLIGGKIRFDAGGDSTNQWTTTQSMSANVLTHIAVTTDWKTKKFYINGNFVQSASVTTVANSGNGIKATIGGSEPSDNGTANGNWLNGGLTDIRIYENMLTDDDVKRIYDNPCWGDNKWIRLTGTQYFDSGLPKRDDYTIELCIQSESQNNDSPVFGVRDAGSGNQLVLWQNTSVLSLRYINTEMKYTYNPQTDLVKKQVITCNKTYLKINGEVVATANTQNYNFSSAQTIMLFTLKNGTSIDSRKFIGKVYWVKVWDSNGKMIRYYVPASTLTRATVQDEIGLKDLIEREFYNNAGSGICQLGEDSIG